MTGKQLVDQGESVAQFAPSRLPWHPAIEDKFGELGVNRASWKALTEAVYPSAKTPDAVVMALSYCAARKLDPFKRPVHIVPMWDSQRREMVETVWPGISEIRTTAFRTGQYAGCDEVEFGPMTTRAFTGRIGRRGQEEEKTVQVTFPEWGRINVYRILNGQRCKFVSPKVYWLESYGRQGASDVPNDMWAKRPSGQLEKCVEAAGLRKAFPEEIGNDYSAEEMAGQVLAIDTPAPERALAPPPPAEVREAISGPVTGQAPVEQPRGPQAPPQPEAEEAEFTEAAKPEEPAKPADAPAPEAKIEGPSFDVPAFLEEAETVFAGCRTEIEVGEAHDMLSDRVEEFLSRPQREQYDELQAAAVRRIEAQAKPGTPAVPGPDDDDEDEAAEETMPEPPPHEVAAAKLCQALNNCVTADDVNAVWNEQKGPLRALVKEGLMVEEFRKGLFKLVEEAHAATVAGDWPNVRSGPAPAQAPTEKPAGDGEESDLARAVDEFRVKIEAVEDTNALNALLVATQEQRDALKVKHGAAADAFKAMIAAARKRIAGLT